MADYRLHADQTVADNLRRIVRDQVDKAVADLTDRPGGAHEAVHEVRKRCKKIRAALRLVRKSFDGYRNENRHYRDTARRVSSLRDAAAAVETLDEQVIALFDGQADKEPLERARRALADRRDRSAEDSGDIEARLAEVLENLQAGRDRIAAWTLDADGFDALGPSIAKTYRRGRKMLAVSADDTTTENLHEWRKRVKYHRYHIRLLQGMWDEPLKARRDALHELSAHLGDDHNLAVLAGIIEADPDDFGSGRDVQALLGLIRTRRGELQARAFPLGRRLFSEDADALLARLRACWDAWIEEQPSDPKLSAPAEG